MQRIPLEVQCEGLPASVAGVPVCQEQTRSPAAMLRTMNDGSLLETYEPSRRVRPTLAPCRLFRSEAKTSSSERSSSGRLAQLWFIIGQKNCISLLASEETSVRVQTRPSCTPIDSSSLMESWYLGGQNELQPRRVTPPTAFQPATPPTRGYFL